MTEVIGVPTGLCYHSLVGTEQTSLLTVNAGSSSVKLGLFATDSLQLLLEVTVANIGLSNASLTLTKSGQAVPLELVQAANHAEATALALDRLAGHLTDHQLTAIGHRIVHGGPTFSEPVIITDTVVESLQAIAPFDPEHLPVALQLIQMFGQCFSGLPQIACFDTAFYKALPPVAQLLPLPRKYASLGLRRYGFHGLSYESLLQNFRATAGEQAAKGRVILAHLGSGASLTALKDGQPLDTTMSFTPASGIVMSSRSGDLDPGIADFLRRQADLSGEAFNHMVHFEAGLLGVSELSADMHELLQHAGSNPQAAEAVALFCYQVRKTIGSFAAVLDGLDSLVFSGGIGENAPVIRESICRGLSYLGLTLDTQRNEAQEFLISAEGSRVGVHVLHTDEAVVIARQTSALITNTKETAPA